MRVYHTSNLIVDKPDVLHSRKHLDFFYNSQTFELISEGVADMHCLSDEYLAEELMLERNKIN